MLDIKSGQIWQKKGEDVTWRVVSVKPKQVALSGPGPCRGLICVTQAELREMWEQPAIYGAAFLLQEQLQSFDAYLRYSIDRDASGSEQIMLHQRKGKLFPKGRVPESIDFDEKSFKVVVHKVDG